MNSLCGVIMLIFFFKGKELTEQCKVMACVIFSFPAV